jgi:O-antigen ligase
MINYSTKLLSKKNVINLLIILIPVSFIAGNLIINLNILLLIVISYIFFKNDIFKIEMNYLDKLVVSLFLYIFFLGIFSSIYTYYFENFTKDLIVLNKTILFLRFFLLYFVMIYLIKNNIINFKYFFIACSVCSLFVCLDLIIQFSFGKDIFGYEKIYPRHTTGPFGDEAIAGTYLQRFSLFSFFLLPFLFKNKDRKKSNFLLLAVLMLTIFSLIIAGNRMPLILFIFSLFLVILFEKYLRRYFIYALIFSTMSFSILYKTNSNIKVHFNVFGEKIYVIASSVISGEIDPKNPTMVFHGHFKEFYAGYETWKQNKIFGRGLKSFKLNCPKKVENCGAHPHNYYLEIMSDLGLVGLLLFIVIFTYSIYGSITNRHKFRDNLIYNNLITPFILILFIEMFPIKTSGSFFTTTNSTFIFLIMAIMIGLSKKQDLN